MRVPRSPSRWVHGLLALILAVAATAAQAQTGTVSVHVTETGGGPIAQAQTAIVSTTIGGLTALDGRVMLRGVPAGTQTVRVLRVGFAEQKKTVEVPAGGSVGVEFTMSAVAVNLTPVVTTATGETRRVEIGNSVSSFTVADITEKAPISSVQDVINARTPGVTVQLGTQTGTGAKIRIRGANSLSLSNEPIWILDGVRMTSEVSGPGTGGNTASRIGDINPAEIENIEIVKGPSAATLYGTDAANGVIVVTTKKGRAGATRWSAGVEGGILTDRNAYPNNYSLAGHAPATPGVYANCAGMTAVSQGTCVLDSVRIYTPFHDPDATPINQGDRSQYAVTANGGTEMVRYFISADQEKETGVLRLPPFERARLNTEGVGFHPWVERPNMLAKYSFRINLQSSLTPELDVQLQTNYINVYQRYTLESNATAGLGSQVFGGQGYKSNGTVGCTGCGPLTGYRAWTPGYTWQEKNDQRVNRTIMSMNVNWRPTTWLQNRMNIGTDLSDQNNGNLLFRGEGPPITATYRNGFRSSTRRDIRTTTADFGSTATWRITPSIVAKTTGGVQYTNYQNDNSNVSGTELPPGSQTPGGAVTRDASEGTTFTKTLGIFVEEAVALNDRLFLTGAVRSDQNSAFGTNFQSVLYPKLSASWLLSEEPWYKQVIPGMNSIRLRAAFGASGVQPGPNDALRFFGTTSTNVRNTDVSGEVFSSQGNPELKPEQSTEYETGFETKFIDNRYSLDFTYYQKKTKDALISAIVPPSYGSQGSIRTNLGSMENRGFEVVLNGQVIDRPNFGLDLTINASKNFNKLASLGGTPPQIGTATRAVEGYPLFAFWSQPIKSWNDANKDGYITVNEIVVDTAAHFKNYSAPRQSVSLTTGMDLLRKRVRFQTLLDYRGGHAVYNNTERIRCVSRQNCMGWANPKSSFEEQAMVVGTLYDVTKTLDGFFQSGDFVKLREVSLSYELPLTWATQMRAKSARFIVSGRNLWKHTLYRGVDPENDYQTTSGGDSPGGDFQTLGAASYFTFRLNVNF